MNALVLSIGPLARFPTFPDAEFLRDQGWAVTMVTGPLSDGAVVPAGVRLIELADVETVAPINRAERFLVLSAPRIALRLLRALLARAGRIRGVGRPARHAARLATAAAAEQPRLSLLAHRVWQRGPYRAIRPFVMWRLTKRLALDDLLTAGADLIVCGDREVSVSVAWHLAKRLPATPVIFAIDRERWPQLPGAVQLSVERTG
jgi:hypothetical protein